MAAVAEQANLSREQLEKSLRPDGDRAVNDGRISCRAPASVKRMPAPRRLTIPPDPYEGSIDEHGQD